MAFSPDSSITGGTQTGLTSPTYTLTSDAAISNGQRQWIVSALGGTQTNVRANTLSDPFSLTFFKPTAPKVLPALSINNRYSSIPVNTYGLLIRKGVRVDSISTLAQARVRVNFDVPANADANDAINIRAMISFLVGVLNEESDDIADTLLTGALP